LSNTKRISKYLSLVKFSHTVFALPFALVAMFSATHQYSYTFDYTILLLIVLCMVFARNAAMSFNRIIDRNFDAINPRTSNREIPSGKIRLSHAILFCIVNAILFVVCAGFINTTCLWLSPLALAIITGYSYTKRFTALSHFFLGLALSVAPFGAFVAVSNEIRLFPLLLSMMVLLWTAGFDIIYSLQDISFDRNNQLHSLPAKLGISKSLLISEILHAFVVVAVLLTGLIFSLGMLYWVGSIIFTFMLIWQHIMVNRRKQKNIGIAFGLLNGIASCFYGLFVILDFTLRL